MISVYLRTNLAYIHEMAKKKGDFLHVWGKKRRTRIDITQKSRKSQMFFRTRIDTNLHEKISHRNHRKHGFFCPTEIKEMFFADDNPGQDCFILE